MLFVSVNLLSSSSERNLQMKRTIHLLGLLLIAALSTGPNSVAASNSSDYDYCFIEEIDDDCFFAVCVDGDDMDWVLLCVPDGIGPWPR
jgi:hypothetical protein